MFETVSLANEINRLVQLLDALLPQWSRTAESEVRARARLFVIVVAFSLVAAAVFAGFHVHHGATLRGLFTLACMVPGIGVLFRLRRSKNLQSVVHAFLAVLLTALVVSPYLSSTGLKVPVMAAIVPFLGAAVAGLVPGLIWTFITLGVLTVSMIVGSSDPVASQIAMNSLVVAATCGIGSCTLEFARTRAKQVADEADIRATAQGRERERAQAALETSQALIEHSFREAPSLLILSDLSTGKIIDVNKSFERVSGWTLAEAQGRTLSELDAWVSPDDPLRLAEIIVSSGRTQDAEIQLRTKSGNVIWMLAAGSIVELAGSVHVLAQGIEITDRKRAEQALAKHREHLESRVEESNHQLYESRVALRRQQQLATIGTLAAGIAHQINNPIGSIMASAEFALLAEGDEDGRAVQLEALRNVVAESERCGKIVRNVLRFARQESTARWIEDLNPLVQRATQLSNSYLLENGGRVVLSIASMPCPARVSPIEIEQVLVNVMRNAAESFEGTGELRVSTRRRGALVEIEITDNGCGMDEQHLAQVFDPFFTTRVHEGGTGLGLSFAHGVIVDHGGELLLDSTPVKGTRARIRLPGVFDDNP